MIDYEKKYRELKKQQEFNEQSDGCFGLIFFVVLIILLLFFSSCGNLCTHEYYDVDQYRHRIDYSAGISAQTELCYKYNIENCCITIYKATDNCMICGRPTKLTQHVLCGTFQIIY